MGDPSLNDKRTFLYAEFVAVDDSAATRVEKLLEALTLSVRAEPGNIAFDAYRKKANPKAFFVYEIYEDETAFRSHLAHEHGRLFNAELTGLVRGGASELTWLTPLSSAH